MADLIACCYSFIYETLSPYQKVHAERKEGRQSNQHYWKKNRKVVLEKRTCKHWMIFPCGHWVHLVAHSEQRSCFPSLYNRFNCRKRLSYDLNTHSTLTLQVWLGNTSKNLNVFHYFVWLHVTVASWPPDCVAPPHCVGLMWVYSTFVIDTILCPAFPVSWWHRPLSLARHRPPCWVQH